MNPTDNNIQTLISYLRACIDVRLKVHFSDEQQNIPLPEVPILEESDSPYYRLQKTIKPHSSEWIVFLLAIVPHLIPGFFEGVLRKYLKSDSDFPEFGGKRTPHARYMHATGDTALFILAGMEVAERLKFQHLFDENHFFAREHILRLEEVEQGESRSSGRIQIENDFVELFTRGFISPPKFSGTFPARYIQTALEWSDLIISQDVLLQLKEINNWIAHHSTLRSEWNMGNKLRPGYLALFHGPPGTGKTLACSLMGKYTGRSVFRVDLSAIVSKYIGETEKNLSSLFAKAENKNWILFFDEADALFGKRTNVKSSNDRFANQEVSYLLQRIESFDGLIVLASNNKSNMDEAFLRRFNSIIEFAFPPLKERIDIWRKSFPEDIQYEQNLDIPALAGRYELAGGNIINVVQFSCLKAIERGRKTIYYEDVELGIKREIEKEGKIFTSIRMINSTN